MPFYTKDTVTNKMITLPVIKIKRYPKMREHKGACWDFGYIYIDGEKVKVYLDIVWGEYIYFTFNNNFYKVRMTPDFKTTWIKKKNWDLNPYDNVNEIFTQKPEKCKS
jgi:hypothetical protein